ncbi:MAG: type II toxin-antitoxin system RelE/ParE family toxin [Spirosomaceae bacterium]|nr:type II toxin-antitoxin system RelE/ParE family toxin [Spirosomataceae bacterium]
MKGFKSFYRIRVGHYRVGCIVEGNSIEFMRISHRKEIYAIFPYLNPSPRL